MAAKGRGIKAGDSVRDYRSATALLPPLEFWELKAESAISGLAVWRILRDAYRQYFDALPEKERRAIRSMARQMAKAQD